MLKRLLTVVLLGGPLALIPNAVSATPARDAGGHEILDHGQDKSTVDDHDHDGDGKPDHDPEDHDKDEKPEPKPKPKG